MPSDIAVLFYVGILIPTIITIAVFLGFLLCLYKHNQNKRQQARLTHRALPATPPHHKKKHSSDKCSQHSVDSAIDLGEVDTSIDEKLGGAGVILDTRKLRESHHAYQNEMMQHSAGVDVHAGADGTLRKGFYPSRETLSAEIHSPVKIYEKMSDVQILALQIQERGEMERDCEKQLLSPGDKAARGESTITRYPKESSISRYTSASKLVAGVCPPTNNQLDKSATNYAAYSSSWYDSTDSVTDSNRHNLDIYRHQIYKCKPSWKPNIAASCSSNTDNYSSMESSQV